jgi:hypothetical protein
MLRKTTSPEFSPTLICGSSSRGRPAPLLLGADGLHHLQGGVPGPQRVVLVGERRTEQRHDAVTHDLVHGAFVGVDCFHHPLDDRVEDLAGLLGIAAGDELHRALHVGKEHRHLLALALERGLGDEDLLGQMLGGIGLGGVEAPGRGLDERDGALPAELVLRRILGPARRADRHQRRGALTAKPHARRVLLLAPWTLHSRGPPRDATAKNLSLADTQRQSIDGPYGRFGPPAKADRRDGPVMLTAQFTHVNDWRFNEARRRRPGVFGRFSERVAPKGPKGIQWRKRRFSTS